LTQFDVIRRNLSRKPFRTGILAAIVFLFSFTLYCGTVISQGLGAGTRMMSERLGADVLFVPYGYDGKIQNSLLRGEPSSFYLDSRFADDLRGEKGVDKVTSQLFIATLRAACCTLPVQLIGIDPRTDFVVRPWMAAVIDRPLGESEVVVGHKIIGRVGETIQLFNREFIIAARLDSTGMGFDTSVFMDLDRARRLLLLSDLGPHLNLPDQLDRNTFVSSTLVKASPLVDIKELVNALSQKYAVKYNLDFVVVAGMISDIASALHMFSGFVYIFSGIVWALALVVIALVFSAIVRERRKEFGVLRVIGASRAALAQLVITEALLLSSAGALLGTGTAGLIMRLFSAYISVALQLPSISPGTASLLFTGGGVFLLGLLTGPLACLPAVRKLGRIDAYIAMREEA
jgi:putative ABC transport system permease protein